MHSTYSSFSKDKNISEGSNVLPETYFINTQLPAFMGRFNELLIDDLPSIWSLSSSSSML